MSCCRVLPLYILVTVLLLAGTARAIDKLIDNFTSHDYINHMSGIRTISGARLVGNGIMIGESDFVVETLTPTPERTILTGKSLKLVYTARTYGTPVITLLQLNSNYIGVDGTSFHVTPQLHIGPRRELTIPLSAFVGADLSYSYGFRFDGPIVLHRLYLVDDTTLGYNPTVPHLNAFTTHLNLNSLRLGRFGRGISKSGNWININDAGFLHEDLVHGSDTINLTASMFRITYSTYNSESILRLKLTYHSSQQLSPNVRFVTTTLRLTFGRYNKVDVPIENFPDIRLHDVKSLRIFGPVRINLIELIKSPEALDRTSNPGETVIIDDLSTWPIQPTVHAPTTMQTHNDPQSPDPQDGIVPGLNRFWSSILSTAPTTPNSDSPHTDPRSGLAPGFNRIWSSLLNTLPLNHIAFGPASGTNKLDRPCEGQGVALTSNGVKLLNFGFIYESLANPDASPIDLTNAYIDIHYSSAELVTRVIQVHCATDSSRYLVDSIVIKFPIANYGSIGARVGLCSLSKAIFITGRGEITIHAIQLRIPICGHPGHFSNAVVDHFLNWHPMSNNPILTSNTRQLHDSHTLAAIAINPEPVVYNLLEPVSLRSPGFYDCDFLIGVGVVISDGGDWAQYLPKSVGMFIKITYTSSDPRTLKITFTAISEMTGEPRLVPEQIMHVVFNQGNSIDVHFPLPKHSSNNIPIAITGIRINGPVVIHQIALLDTAPSLESVEPGASSADAYLVDDFTDWSDARLNFGALDEPMSSIEPGSITINAMHEYLLERIEDSEFLPLHHLAFRITYSIASSTSCKMSLTPELWDGRSRSSRQESPAFSEITFHAGTHNQLLIPMSYLLNKNPVTSIRYYSYHIQGPPSRNGKTPEPLTLHKVEMTSVVPFSQSIIPNVNVMRSKKANIYQLKLDTFKHELSFLRLRSILNIKVRRDRILEDAYRLVELDPVDLQQKMNVTFGDEIGQDAGGLTREFFSLIADHINKPDSDLFVSSADVDYALQINPNSDIQVENYLNYYKLVGRLIGMAILNESVINIRLVSLLYKKLISEPTEIRRNVPKLSSEDTLEVDIEALNEIEPELYTQLKWCLREDVTDLGLTMTLHANRGGKMETIELVENGSQYEVTQANKRQYVQKYAYWHTEIKVQAQANALRDGVWDVVPRWLLSKFTESELELLISGRKEINVNDWRTHTTLVGYHSEDPSILLFWECVQGMTNKKRSMLLRFVTGSPNVPAAGFPGLEKKFTIAKADQSQMYPKAQTCAHLMTLPPFTDPKIMCERLDIATLPETGQFSYV